MSKFLILTESNQEIIYNNLDNTLNPCPDFSYAREVVKPFIQHEYEKPDFDSLLTKQLPITHLRIQLGLKCNYSCSFCIQQQYSQQEKYPTQEEIDSVIILVSKITSEKCHIEFWGGEPLVYIKLLEQLLLRLREIRPKAKFSMITNGTLLTYPILSLLLKYRVHLSISHDGFAYFLRGKDPANDFRFVDLLQQGYDIFSKNNLGFNLNCVISQYNCDLIKLDQWFNQRLTNIPYIYEGVVIAHSSNAIPFTKLSNQDYRLLDESIQRAILTSEYPRIAHALSKWILLILRFLAYQLDTRKISGKCDAAKPHVLSIDMHGNILSCHNVDSSQVIGSVQDIQEQFKVQSKFKHWSLRLDCINCFALLSCRGNCMRNDETYHTLSCPIQKQFHTSLMKAVLGLLYKEQIQFIEQIIE